MAGSSYKFEAIRDDAKRWDEAATVLKKAQKAVEEDLALTRKHFSAVADVLTKLMRDGTGLVEVYEDVHTKVVRLLGEGHECFADMEGRLLAVADAMERTDEASSQQLANLERASHERSR